VNGGVLRDLPLASNVDREELSTWNLRAGVDAPAAV